MAILKEVFFNDGEALDTADLNNLQRFHNALLSDGAVGGLAGPDSVETPESGHFYAISNGAAAFARAGAREVGFAEGLGGISTSATITGDAPKFLLFYVKEADISNRTRPAPAVNPRWDILSVSFAEATGDNESRDFKDGVTGALSTQSIPKRRRVVPTFTWTSGVENVSPTEPATPPGEVKICAVLVPVAAVPFSPAAMDLRDYRMPLGRRSIARYPTAIFNFNGAASAIATVGGNPPGVMLSIGGGAERSESFFFPGHQDAVHRVVGISLLGVADVSANHQIKVRSDVSPGVSTSDFYTSAAIVPTSIGWASASMPIPVWSNGFTAGYAAVRAGLSPRRVWGQWVCSGTETGSMYTFIFHLRGM